MRSSGWMCSCLGLGNTRHLCSWGTLGCSGRAGGCLVGLGCRMCHLDLQGLSVGSGSKPTPWPQGCQMGLWLAGHRSCWPRICSAPAAPRELLPLPLLTDVLFPWSKPGYLGLLRMLILGEPHVLLRVVFQLHPTSVNESRLQVPGRKMLPQVPLIQFPTHFWGHWDGTGEHHISGF